MGVEGSATKRSLRQTAHDTLETVQGVVNRATALLAAPAALRERVRQQVAILNAGEVEVRLADLPVSELKRANTGARVAALELAGLRTVADVRRMGPHGLRHLRGIGEATEQQILRAAELVAQGVARDTTFRIDPDRRNPGQNELLGILAAIPHADRAVSALGTLLEQTTEDLKRLVAEAERVTSRWRMFWSRRARKDAALSALSRLNDALVAPNFVSLSHTLDSATAAADPRSYPPDQVWRDYEANAAAVNTLLASILDRPGDADDLEAAQGFVGQELRQRITAVPLDTGLLTGVLRGYQVFGAQYAIHQERSILGDEMGLGKTVQALAVLAHLAAKGQRRFLVVCPASVQVNWLNEIERHTTLTAYSLHGRDREVTGRHWLRDGGVAVTTFDTLGRLSCLDNVEVAMLVVDEAHQVKNPDIKRSQNVDEAVNRAQRVLFMTGTPLENSVDDFRNLVAYLQPAIAAGVHVGDSIAGARAFRRAVAPVYLRRNQEDVLTELPEKIKVEDWVRLSGEDEENYRQAVAAGNLMLMRRAAFVSAMSAKLERLDELVKEAMDDGLNVVVFSYFLDVLAAVGRRLGDRVTGRITGTTTPAARQQIVDGFSRVRPATLLGQVEAGGVGLNLQSASVVILAEPQWKPSIEEQAIGRLFRMGQTRRVQVHRLLAEGSVDDRILEVQFKKRLLFDEYARRSDAKDADSRAVDSSEHRPSDLDEEKVPLERRVILAEQHRLGMT